MVSKEVKTKIINSVLKNTLGHLDVGWQYRIAGWFGFKVTDANSQPAYPEFHFPVQQSPDKPTSWLK
jgi:hypothetical protein